MNRNIAAALLALLTGCLVHGGPISQPPKFGSDQYRVALPGKGTIALVRTGPMEWASTLKYKIINNTYEGPMLLKWYTGARMDQPGRWFLYWSDGHKGHASVEDYTSTAKWDGLTPLVMPQTNPYRPDPKKPNDLPPTITVEPMP